MRYDRKPTTMNLDKHLWFRVKLIASGISEQTYKMPCDLMEEAIKEYIIPKYKQYLPEEYRKEEGK